MRRPRWKAPRARPSAACLARGVAALLLASLAALVPAGASAEDASARAIARGDQAWRQRADRLDGDLARPERIAEAIARYREALGATPETSGDARNGLEAAWKLLRALHYAVDFTTLDEAKREARLEEAIALARERVAQLDETGAADERTPGARDRARLLFWSSIVWGARAQRVGLLTIVREGVASRMHEQAERALAIDPTIDRGGPLRLLSRLHASLPRVPFVSGWVDRERAIPLAERAHALDDGHPGNALVLALALLEQAPDRRAEARALLEGLSRRDPREEARVEDMAILEDARDRLARLDEEGR